MSLRSRGGSSRPGPEQTAVNTLRNPKQLGLRDGPAGVRSLRTPCRWIHISKMPAYSTTAQAPSTMETLVNSFWASPISSKVVKPDMPSYSTV